MKYLVVDSEHAPSCFDGKPHRWYEENGGWVGCTMCHAVLENGLPVKPVYREAPMRDEYYSRFNEGITLGKRRSDDVTRSRLNRRFVYGFIAGVAVGIVGYIEFVSTFSQ